MISKTIGYNGVHYFQTHPNKNLPQVGCYSMLMQILMVRIAGVMLVLCRYFAVSEHLELWKCREKQLATGFIIRNPIGIVGSTHHLLNLLIAGTIRCYPLVMTKSLLLKMAIEMVDLHGFTWIYMDLHGFTWIYPLKMDLSIVIYVNVYQRLILFIISATKISDHMLSQPSVPGPSPPAQRICHSVPCWRLEHGSRFMQRLLLTLLTSQLDTANQTEHLGVSENG